jgi:hypothetical protein
MIAKTLRRGKAAKEVEAKGFDAFELRLGDLMRGERATLGKSLLDVQRELKIKAAYIAAIENCDPTAFDTPGFIAGYVRSYARYLAMDPDWAFETFCRESGFQTAHGMSKEASPKRAAREISSRRDPDEMFAKPATPFVPAGESVWAQVEPSAIGSIFVLVALAALGTAVGPSFKRFKKCASHRSSKRHSSSATLIRCLATRRLSRPSTMPLSLQPRLSKPLTGSIARKRLIHR